MDFKAILNGEIIPMDDVNDKVFSERMMGDGFAFIPHSGEIFAPIDGEILSVYPTGHALAIQSQEGHEILIHVGLGSFQSEDDIFMPRVKEGSSVKQGDLILSFDLDKLKENDIDITTPLVFLSGEKVIQPSKAAISIEDTLPLKD